jgi:TonB family protein
MEHFAAYLMKSVIWLTGFALVYFLFLQNERYFLLKRFYLIAGMLFSFLLPLVTVHYHIAVPPPAEVSTGFGALYPVQGIPIQHDASIKSFDFRFVLLLIYLSGILFLGFRLIKQAAFIFKNIRKSGRILIEGVNVVRTSEFSGSFSFFNYVIISSSINEAESEIILKHELVHVNQFHWIDLLLAEILRVFQWINPFAWVYPRFIKQNHEFMADAEAIKRIPDQAVYKAVLVNQILDSRVFRLSDSFNYSLNKRRFEMMRKIVSSPYRKIKLLLVLPVFAIILYAFGRPEYKYTDQSEDSALNVEASPFPAGRDTSRMGLIKTMNVDGTKVEELEEVNRKSNQNGSQNTETGSVLTADIKKDNTAITRQGSVKGTVLNADGKPVQGVNVTATGSAGHATYVTTGPDGRFELTDVQSNARIVFSCRGYKGLALDPDFNREMTVHLETDPDYVPPSPQVAQRAEPLVVVDGAISDKKYTEVRKELGYDFGTMKMLQPAEAEDKYGDKGANGVVEILTRKKALDMGLNPPYPRLGPDDFPTFGGKSFTLFNDWVIDHVKYPPEAQKKSVEGYVNVNFTIEPDGTISNIKPSGQGDPLLANEVIDVIKTAPAFDPPKNTAIKEPLNLNVTVGFKLPDQIVKQMPFVVVEDMPLYPGGDKALLDFLKDNLKYPESARAEKIEGRVIVRFIVNVDGNVEGLSVLKGVNPELDAEALRVVGLLKGFKPGMQGGKAVPVWFMVPVNFSLSPEQQ